MCFCISFSHWVHSYASLGFPFVVIHLVVHTWSRSPTPRGLVLQPRVVSFSNPAWSRSPTPRGLDWIDASEVSAAKYFMDNYLDISTCRGSVSTL
jgi:hypothetical protein